MHVVELILVGTLIYRASKLCNNAVGFVFQNFVITLLRCMKIIYLLFFILPMREVGKPLGFNWLFQIG